MSRATAIGALAGAGLTGLALRRRPLPPRTTAALAGVGLLALAAERRPQAAAALARAGAVGLAGAAASAGLAGLWTLGRRRAPTASYTGDLTGAPVPLMTNARRRVGVSGAARVAPPPWEPRSLRALAGWEPAAARTLPGRLAAYLWAAPLTLVGLLLGLASAGRPQLRDGVVVFTDAGGPLGPVLRRRGFHATAVGHVVVASGRPSPALLAHELVHVRQSERLGPLFGPLYLALLAAYGYGRHPLERAARRASRRVLGAPV